MTPRELELLVKVFDAFLDGRVGGEFLITNASMQGIAHVIGDRLRNEPEDQHENLLQHFIDHGQEEQQRLLAEARDRGDVAIFYGSPRTVLTEQSATALANRPSPRNNRGF